jgi:hypothetical protein
MSSDNVPYWKPITKSASALCVDNMVVDLVAAYIPFGEQDSAPLRPHTKAK